MNQASLTALSSSALCTSSRSTWTGTYIKRQALLPDTWTRLKKQHEYILLIVNNPSVFDPTFTLSSIRLYNAMPESACQQCLAMKKECDEKSPCGRCASQHIECSKKTGLQRDLSSHDAHELGLNIFVRMLLPETPIWFSRTKLL